MLRQEFGRRFRLTEREALEEWLAARQEEHRERTAEIVPLETELNARVYDVFGLTAEEIQIIERAPSSGMGRCSRYSFGSASNITPVKSSRGALSGQTLAYARSEPKFVDSVVSGGNRLAMAKQNG